MSLLPPIIPAGAARRSHYWCSRPRWEYIGDRFRALQYAADYCGGNLGSMRAVTDDGSSIALARGKATLTKKA
jgi:hypothetical protein